MTTTEIISVLQAHERGEAIEIKNNPQDTAWSRAMTPQWNFGHCEYRVAPVQPKTIPLTPADVPPGSVVRHNKYGTGIWASIATCGARGLVYTAMYNGTDETDSRLIEWSELAADWQILRPGGVWEPASKTQP